MAFDSSGDDEESDGGNEFMMKKPDGGKAPVGKQAAVAKTRVTGPSTKKKALWDDSDDESDE